MPDRKFIQDVFIRTARDSGFAFNGVELAVFVGKLLDISPFMVYAAFSDMDAMNAVAAGTHPAVKNEK